MKRMGTPFRNGLIGLLLWTLLSSPAIGAGPALAAEPSADAGRRTAATLMAEVAAMGLCIVKDGRASVRLYTAEELTACAELDVDGYVNGVVLLGTAPLTVSVDDRAMDPIRTLADGSYHVKHFGVLSDQEFWSTFLPEATSPAAADRLRARYAAFPPVPGEAVSTNPEFSIRIDGAVGSHILRVRQAVRRRLDACDPPPDDQRTPELYCLGDVDERFDSTSSDYRTRLHAILDGIAAVEAVVDRRLVERVHFIDFEGPHNAYTTTGEDDIWFYDQVFWNESTAELRTMAEHETLHILADRLGLPGSSRIRELFADLRGFTTLSPDRFAVVTTGRPTARGSDQSPPPGSLFGFINEANFLRGMRGGHAQDDVDEFCASFLHTLMYVDRLASQLDRPIVGGNGSATTLSAGQRRALADDYARVLAVMIESLPPHPPAWSMDIFRSGLEAVRGIDAARSRIEPTAMRAVPPTS